MPYFNPWMTLHRGDIDQLVATNRAFCRQSDPTGVYLCTRTNGHSGFHVATCGGGRVCTDSWGSHPAMSLPEGF